MWDGNIQVCGFFLPVSYEHNGFSKGIFSDYDWKCNCFGHYLLVFLSNDICDKYYDDIACDFTKWNIGRRYCNIYLTGSGRFDWKSVSVFGDGENCFWICIRILCLLCKGKVEGVQKKGYGIFLIIIANVNIWVLVGNLTISIHAEGDLVKIWSGIITFMLLLVDMIALKLYLIYQEKVEEKV